MAVNRVPSMGEITSSVPAWTDPPRCPLMKCACRHGKVAQVVGAGLGDQGGHLKSDMMVHYLHQWCKNSVPRHVSLSPPLGGPCDGIALNKTVLKVAFPPGFCAPPQAHRPPCVSGSEQKPCGNYMTCHLHFIQCLLTGKGDRK